LVFSCRRRRASAPLPPATSAARYRFDVIAGEGDIASQQNRIFLENCRIFLSTFLGV
jgi:hypothetical protein